jgi:hypothetical protein
MITDLRSTEWGSAIVVQSRRHRRRRSNMSTYQMCPACALSAKPGGVIAVGDLIEIVIVPLCELIDTADCPGRSGRLKILLDDLRVAINALEYGEANDEQLIRLGQKLIEWPSAIR